MAITTYAELQAFVTAHLELDADTEAQLPNLIQMAEAELGRNIISPAREAVAYADTTASTQTLALPSDFKRMRSASIEDDILLSPVELNELRSNVTGETETDKPEVYAISGLTLYFGPIPDAAYTVTINYTTGLTALSNSATSNWLLESHPDAYVYSVLAQCEAYLHNDERAVGFQGKADAIVSQINDEGRRMLAPDSTPVRMAELAALSGRYRY